ncbi:MAG TPA: FAD-dependent oxidoreductase [Candidatus Saccharimonadales bacterium]|nr:FAD-dependent oxidoreductase [Candidatus Saccharimonadales bacterium]
MRLKFTGKKKEIENVYTFTFEPGKKISWQPGQYLHYELPHPDADDRGVERWFTISAPPSEKHPTITTRFDTEHSSTFKKALQKLEPGTEVEAGEPRGDFLLEPDASRHVLIAGGIGVTPYHSMLLQLDRDGKPLNIDLLYANRDQNFVFGDEFQKLAVSHPELKIHKFIGGHRISKSDLKKYLNIEQRGTQTDGVPGAGEQRIKAYVKYDEVAAQPATQQSAGSSSGATSLAGGQAAAVRDPVFYVSGPRPMVEAYQHLLEDLGVSPERVKTDYFPGYKLG